MTGWYDAVTEQDEVNLDPPLHYVDGRPDHYAGGKPASCDRCANPTGYPPAGYIDPIEAPNGTVTDFTVGE
jgi:hypothetical protein